MSSTSSIRFSRTPAAIILLGAEALAARQQEIEHQQALDAAHQHGIEEAMQALEAKMRDEREKFAALQETTLRTLAEQQVELVGEMRQLLPELAVEIARRVLVGMEPDRDTVVRIARETLAEIEPGSPEVEVWFNAQDLGLVRGIEEEFGQKYPGIRFSCDPELGPGDCRARSRFGEIDGRVATKLQTLARALS